MTKWLTVEEAAEYLRISVSTLNKLRSTGGGPRYSKPNGGRVLYKEVDLDEWVRDGTRASTFDAPTPRRKRGRPRKPVAA